MEANKYQRGQIYKIVSDETDKIYIGSTTEKYLSNRLKKHRANYKLYQNGKYHYVTSYEILQYPDHRIILLERYPCETRAELLAREEDYLEHYKDDIINKFKAWGGNIQEYNQQYYIQNKEKMVEMNKKYREENTEKIKEYKQQWYEQHREQLLEKIICECGGRYSRRSKNNHFNTKKHQAHEQQKE